MVGGTYYAHYARHIFNNPKHCFNILFIRHLQMLIILVLLLISKSTEKSYTPRVKSFGYDFTYFINFISEMHFCGINK